MSTKSSYEKFVVTTDGKYVSHYHGGIKIATTLVVGLDMFKWQIYSYYVLKVFRLLGFTS